MKKYKVFIRGENFLMNVEGVKKKLGFYTARFVEANSEEEAGNAVMDMLRADLKFEKSALNDRSDSPVMYAQEIEELKSFDGYPYPGAGFIWFPSESEGNNS